MGASSVTGVSGYGTVAGVQKGNEHMSLGVERLVGPRHVYVGNSTLAGTNAVQTVTITGGPAGGTFTLTYSGQTTAGIAFNAIGSAVQTALVALSTIGASNVTVTGSAGGPYTVTFVGALAGRAAATLTTSAASLTGGTSPAVGVAVVTVGSGNSTLQVALPTASVSDYVVMLTSQAAANAVGVTSFSIDSTTLEASVGIGGIGGDIVGVAILKKGYAGAPVTDGVVR